MRKYIQISLWVLLAIAIIAILYVVSTKQDKMVCKTIKVDFLNSGSDKYIDNKYVESLIGADSIINKPLKKINISSIESILNNNEYIEHAEVYKKLNGNLQIDISQRKPIVRIINSYNIGYYIGKEGVLMPISKKLNRRMIVANGYVDYSPDFDSLVNIYSPLYDSDSSMLVLRSIHKLVNYIDADKFWKAQLQQVYVTEQQEFELIPLVGSHIIIFGKIDMYEEKLRKLQVMYQKGFSSVGWNKYKTVNLKYNKQVVCGK